VNAELIQENESLTAERDKYKNLSQRLAIMFNTTNNYSISDHIDKPPYNGGSGPGAFCFWEENQGRERSFPWQW